MRGARKESPFGPLSIVVLYLLGLVVPGEKREHTGDSRCGLGILMRAVVISIILYGLKETYSIGLFEKNSLHCTVVRQLVLVEVWEAYSIPVSFNLYRVE
jgi:uncharacterized protein YqhQ